MKLLHWPLQRHQGSSPMVSTALTNQEDTFNIMYIAEAVIIDQLKCSKVRYTIVVQFDLGKTSSFKTWVI